jgi:hypothetical protein
MKYPAFQAALKTRWNALFTTQIQLLPQRIYPTVDSIARSRYTNFLTWDVIGHNQEWYTTPEVLAAVTYEEQVKFLYDYLSARIAWLNTTINAL